MSRTGPQAASAHATGEPATGAVPPSVRAVRELVVPALRAAVARLGPASRRVAEYHMGWTDADGRPAEGGGKALRPMLALLSARAAGAPPERGVPGAVAVELVHAFSLLHDDIMDGDRIRRHRPAAWTVFGVADTILAGDALLVLAENILLDEGTQGAYGAARSLTAATGRLIHGQALDLEFERRDDVSLDECLAMSDGKTAALMACSCSIGALLAEAPAPLVSDLAAFGSQIGLAFQLVDDLLGIWGREEVTGKPVLSDLRARKKSLPVVAALGAGEPSSRRLHELMSMPGETDLVAAAALVEEAGGRAWAQAEAAHRLRAGRRHLARVPADVRAEFLDIARFITAREN